MKDVIDENFVCKKFNEKDRSMLYITGSGRIYVTSTSFLSVINDIMNIRSTYNFPIPQLVLMMTKNMEIKIL